MGSPEVPSGGSSSQSVSTFSVPTTSPNGVRIGTTDSAPSICRRDKEMSTNRGKTALHSNTLCSLLQQCFLLLFFLHVCTACPQLVLFSICTYVRGIRVREGLAIRTTSLPRCRCGVLTQRSAPRCSWTDWGCRGGDRCRWQ